MPRVDLPEILLEIAARTGFSEAFTHCLRTQCTRRQLSPASARLLLGGACNTGLEPLIRTDKPAPPPRGGPPPLRRPGCPWVMQELYPRRDTLSAG
ncbi:Tn3 family transposase [Enterobacter hormaechei]|uniref:Tn3 family transposase n=1 Tax=Enterobacter hormaechei TaxID=158836 RepID=UPI003CC58DCB